MSHHVPSCPMWSVPAHDYQQVRYAASLSVSLKACRRSRCGLLAAGTPIWTHSTESQAGSHARVLQVRTEDYSAPALLAIVRSTKARGGISSELLEVPLAHLQRAEVDLGWAYMPCIAMTARQAFTTTFSLIVPVLASGSRSGRAIGRTA